jgi:peptidoglycan/LPS O-acetylase OafA/YrhL
MQHQNSYLSNLTPLRGIAALLVAVYHFDDLMAQFVPTTVSLFISKGYLMVDVFFIMSGLIITHVYQESFRHGVGAITLGKFMGARFSRVYPMHFFTLLIVIASFLSSGEPPNDIMNPWAIPSNLLLIHSLHVHDMFTWNVSSWSISAEWWCYLIFPFLIRFLDTNKKIAVPLLVVFSLMTYWSIAYWLPRSGPLYPLGAPVPNDLNVTYDYGFLRGLSGFVVGMLLYKLFEMPQVRKVFSTDGIFWVFTLSAIVGMRFAIPDVACIPLFAGIVFCTACNGGMIHRAFQWRFLQMLGDVSYSIYMLHVILIFSILEGLRAFGIQLTAVQTHGVTFWPGLLGCIGFLTVLIVLSSWSYRWLEKPCRDFLNRKISPAASL